MKRETRGFSGVETALFSIMLVSEQLSQGEGPTSPVGTQHTTTIIETLPQLQNISNTYRKTRTRTRRMSIRIPQSNVPSSVADKTITKEMHDRLERATTTASSVESEQGSGNISKTQTKEIPSGPSSLRTSSKGGPGCHVTMGDSLVQARPERLSNLPNEPPLGEGKVTALENELKSTKVVYNKALIILTKRVKKLEKKLKHKRRRAVVDSSKDEEASLDKEDSPKLGRMIDEIDEDENTNLVKSSKLGEAHEIAGYRKESDDTKVVDFSTASSQKDDDEETLAKTLVSIKKIATKDKGKAIMQESEPSKKIKKKEMIQISLDEEIAQRFYEEEQVQLLMDEEYAQQIQAQWQKKQPVEEEIVQQEKVVAKQVVKQRSKKAGGRLKIKTSKAREDKEKRQKKQDDPEKLTLMDYVEVISDFEDVISVIPLAVKSPIVNWKSYCKGDVGYYEIHRADGSYKTYIFFSEMLNDFDREDLIVLYKLFNENQELIEWKLYDSCGVHSLMLGEVSIHMLVEKKYPLPHDTLIRMLQWKLHVNYNVTEMAYELLGFISDQLNQ
uniref:Uncharacterized protein n=1 Tax=Tanacetum cinerariifolium TaxID=118510 RepID=A0A699ILN5_TANCI|nr:hypothetical protein [Tanacetum cinerariifolium]